MKLKKKQSKNKIEDYFVKETTLFDSHNNIVEANVIIEEEIKQLKINYTRLSLMKNGLAISLININELLKKELEETRITIKVK